MLRTNRKCEATFKTSKDDNSSAVQHVLVKFEVMDDVNICALDSLQATSSPNNNNNNNFVSLSFQPISVSCS